MDYKRIDTINISASTVCQNEIIICSKAEEANDVSENIGQSFFINRQKYVNKKKTKCN